MNIQNIQPVADRVIIRKDGMDKKTTTGIFIPPTAKNKKKTGTVLKAGPNSTLKEGDRIFFFERNPVKIESEKGEVLITPEINVLAVI